MIYRVECRLAGPVVARDEIHLDGLLAAAHPLAHELHVTRSTPLEELERVPVPILAYGHVALCTAATYEDGARLGGEHGVKRRDGADIDWLSLRYSPRAGPGKDRLDRLPVVYAASALWRCWSFDRRGLKRMLRRVRHLGARRSHGWGAISGWTIEDEPDADPVSLLVAAGRAVRALPRSWCTWWSSEASGAVRPPYWHPGRQVDVVPVGARVELDPHLVEKIRDTTDAAWRRRCEQRRERCEDREHARAGEDETDA